MYNVFTYYFIFMNILGFIIMYIDKSKAKKHKWRIKETTLFYIAILGGALGSILGMKVFHHKTKHKTFTIGMPLIFFIHCLIIYIFIK